MELSLSKCTIRDFKFRDDEDIAKHANNKKVSTNLRDSFPHPYTLNDAKEWIKLVKISKPVTNFAITIDDHVIGGIGLMLGAGLTPGADNFSKSAELGYWLGEPYWGRGIMTEAVKAFSEFVFKNFELERVFAGIYEWNISSMRVLEKAGFKLEGIMRKEIIKDGKIIDRYIYSLIRDQIIF